MEDKVIIRFANDDETFISIDVIKKWDIVFGSLIGDTQFCSAGGAHFSISLDELKKIQDEQK